MEKRDDCPFCRGSIRDHWTQVDVSCCRSCGLLFRNPAPTLERLGELYQQSWTDPEHCKNETGGTTQELANTYVRKLARTLGREHFEGLRILDFGAGNGSMLQALRDMGAEAHGVEPYGYEGLVERGFPAYRSIGDIPQGTQFDGIVTLDAVEHLYEPWNELGELYDWLKPEGWMYVYTPNAGGLKARILKARWTEVLKAVHLIFFTPRSLEKVLNRSGFSRVERLRWFVRHTKNPLKVVMHHSLQLFSTDGVLRYLAWK